MKVVGLFPGQNSRHPDMIARLRRLTPVADTVLDAASDILGRDLRAHYEPANASMFACNRDVQVGVFLVSYILLKAIEAGGVQIVASAGLSLGEYTHLVHAGALRFEDALPLLTARGDAYDRSPHGLMVSVFPCDAAQVERVLAPGVEIGIHLASRHFVLSGAHAAVRTASARVEEEAYAQTRVIDHRLPMHSHLLRPVADEFRATLDGVQWHAPTLPYLANVDGQFAEPATKEGIVDSLYRHVFTGVRWSQSLRTLTGRFPGAAFVEIGPKSVLTDLFTREHRRIPAFPTDDADGSFAPFRQTLDALRSVTD